MKKLLALFLALILLLPCGGCAQVRAADLMAQITPNPVAPGADLALGNNAARAFAVTLLQNTIKDGENTLVSPLSVLYALGMTANGAEGETLAQLEAVLGMEAQSWNEYLLAYQKALPQNGENRLHMANALWFKDSPDFRAEAAFLQKNADWYGAGIYKAPFTGETCREINRWVKEHTEGMIPHILDEIPEEAVLYLVNALSFEAEWASVYERSQVMPEEFTCADGTIRKVSMMRSEEHVYLEDGGAVGFLKYYKGRDYAFVALLPKEGVSVSDYAASLSGQKLGELLENPESCTVYAGIPKFEVEYSVDLAGPLAAMGMPDAFDSARAELSAMGHSEAGPLYLARVQHKTFLSLNERGTRAGAAAMEEFCAGACAPTDPKTVILDRPFIYLIVDCKNNVPVFMGTVLDPGR